MLPLRLGIDTNILVSAANKTAGSQRIFLLFAIIRPARLYMSRPIIEKYSSVAVILDWTDLDLFPAHGVCRMTVLEIEIRL